MAPPVPPKPQVVGASDGGAIIAWLGTYPCRTTFKVYWQVGALGTVPAQPFPNLYEEGLVARTSSVRLGLGDDVTPTASNIYVAVSSINGTGESAQSEPVFLSICNSTNADEVAVAQDNSFQRKLLRTDEKGGLELSESVITLLEEIRDSGGGGGPGGVFGTEYQFEVSEDVSTMTGSGTYLEKVSLTTGNLPSGEYRIGWSYSWNLDSTSQDFLARVQINNLDEILAHQQEPKDARGNYEGTGSNQKHQISGWKVVPLSGVNTIDLDWSHTGPDGIEASIWNARIEIWRVT